MFETRVQAPWLGSYNTQICFRKATACLRCSAGHFFSFARLLFGELSSVPQKVRNVDSRVGFHFAAAISSNAQNQLHHHVRAEDDDFRDSREPGVVAADSPPLSLHSLSLT
jgi:hypothetical protein